MQWILWAGQKWLPEHSRLDRGWTMVRKTLTYGGSKAVALRCVAEEDLGNIYRRFHDELCSPSQCPYAASVRPLRLGMAIVPECPLERHGACEIYAVNGGMPLTMTERPAYSAAHEGRASGEAACKAEDRARPRTSYWYDFAIVGECSNTGGCLDAFLKRIGLSEAEGGRSCLSAHELISVIKRRTSALYGTPGFRAEG